MRHQIIRFAALAALIGLAGCNLADSGTSNIHLPEGDVDEGQAHFVALGCVSCHTVSGAELPELAATGPRRVLLGARRMTYGELVTAVVNPSHRLSPRYRRAEVSQDNESLMTTYNDVMTVTELTDIVAFLQAHHETAPRPGYTYPVYKYGSDDAAEDSEQGADQR